jgi:hypothetical protein
MQIEVHKFHLLYPSGNMGGVAARGGPTLSQWGPRSPLNFWFFLLYKPTILIFVSLLPSQPKYKASTPTWAPT